MSTAVPTQSFGYGFAAAGTVFHAALVIALFVIMIGFVPNAKKTFDEFGLTLPWLTLTMIRVSNWVVEYWWALVPLLLILGAGDFGLTAALRTHNRTAMVLWNVAVSLVLIAAIAAALVAIELPMVKLKEGLAR